jgi:hypothetical protein
VSRHRALCSQTAMKIDTRKDCKRMSAQECFLLRNKAIPKAALDRDGDEEEALLGRAVAYEPYLIHSPVLVSTRLRGKSSSRVRLSKKYMHKLNDVVEGLTVDDLADAIDALVISKDEEKTDADFAQFSAATDSAEAERRDSPPLPVVSSCESDQESERGESQSVSNLAPPEALGRVQLKVVDDTTKEEVLVTRCVRFMDTEEGEI